LLSFVIALWGRVSITVDTLHWFYSTVCQVLGTLLGIIVVLAIFLLQIRPATGQSDLVKGLLTRSVEGLCTFYGITIILSFMGLVFLPVDILVLNIFEIKTIGNALHLSIFVSVFGLVFVCITYLLFAFFEILAQQKHYQSVSLDKFL
jgi:hypothetical protein